MSEIETDFYFKFINKDCSGMEYVPLSNGCLIILSSDNLDGTLALEIPFDGMEEMINHMTRHCKDNGRLK